MKTAKLEEKLNQSIEEFRENVQSNYETARSQHCTPDDLQELARQTFYALNDFKKHIVEFLKEQ